MHSHMMYALLCIALAVDCCLTAAILFVGEQRMPAWASWAWAWALSPAWYLLAAGLLALFLINRYIPPHRHDLR